MSGEDRPIGLDGCGANAAPYVLGALTAQESAAFVTHMESCAVCREEVAALEAVVAVLPSSAPPVSASADLKRRVMASVHEDERRQRSVESVVAGRSQARRSRAHARPVWRGALAAGALAAVVIALAVVALSSSGTGGHTRVIRAQVIPAHASALLNVNGGHAELKIAGMPQTAPGRVYEVWIKRTGAPRPTNALFTIASGGAATVGVPGGVSGVSEVLVTSEPRGGSPAPTTQPVIIAHVS